MSDIKGINGTAVELVGGRRLNADILVIARELPNGLNEECLLGRCGLMPSSSDPVSTIAVGHEIQTRPEFLEGLQIGKKRCHWLSHGSNSNCY